MKVQTRVTLEQKIMPIKTEQFRTIKKIHDFIYFAQKEPIKVEIQQSSCQFWNNKSVFLQILHHSSVSWDITHLYIFSWNFIYFQQKKLIKVQILWNLTWAVKVWNSALWWVSLSKSHKVSTKKVQKSYLSWHWRVM